MKWQFFYFFFLGKSGCDCVRTAAVSAMVFIQPNDVILPTLAELCSDVLTLTWNQLMALFYYQDLL